MIERIAFDVAAYERKVTAGGCFICDIVNGEPGMEHEVVVYDDGLPVAFLSPKLRRLKWVNSWVDLGIG